MKLPSLFGVRPRYEKRPSKYLPGKSYWGFRYSQDYSKPDLVHKFSSKGRPDILFSDRTLRFTPVVSEWQQKTLPVLDIVNIEQYWHSSPPQVLSIVSKYPKKLLKGLGVIRIGGTEIAKSAGANAGGLYRPELLGLKATIDIPVGATKEKTLPHEIAHHIQSQHLLLALRSHIPLMKRTRIGGPTAHSDTRLGEDFAETISIIQTSGKKGLDEAYKTKAQSKDLASRMAYAEHPDKKFIPISEHEIEEAKRPREKLFEMVVARYGVPRHIAPSDPAIPKPYRAGEFEGDITYGYPSERYAVPVMANVRAFYETKAPAKSTTEYAGPAKQAEKEAEMFGKGGAIRDWPRTPKVALRSVPNTYNKKYAANIKTKGIFLGRKQVGDITYYPDGDIADFGVDIRYQRKGIGTEALGQLLRKTGGHVSGESSHGSGLAFWKKMGAEMDYSYSEKRRNIPNVFPSFTLDRESYEASQLDLRENKSHGLLNPEVVYPSEPTVKSPKFMQKEKMRYLRIPKKSEEGVRSPLLSKPQSKGRITVSDQGAQVSDEEVEQITASLAPKTHYDWITGIPLVRQYIPVKDILPYETKERGYNKDEKKIRKYMRLQKHGDMDPIAVSRLTGAPGGEPYQAYEGHHRLEAARRLGKKYILTDVNDPNVPLAAGRQLELKGESTLRWQPTKEKEPQPVPEEYAPPIESEETIAAELYSGEPFVREGRAKQKPLLKEAQEATDEEILEQLYPEG